MMDRIGANNPFGRPFALGHNVSKNINGLSYIETEILDQIRSKVSSQLGVPVKFNLGRQSDCGLTVAIIGMTGASACGTREPFLITHNILTEMAEDEGKYQKWMSWIQDQMRQQVELENIFQYNQRRHDEMESERRSHQARVNMMMATDFWLENRSEGQSWTQPLQGQALQNVAGRYMQMLSGN